MNNVTTKYKTLFLFFICLAVNILFWTHTRDQRQEWANVPPVPSENGAVFLGVGDKQFSYRILNTILQNIGNTGANIQPLNNYNYDTLGKWFMVLHNLDPISDYTPNLAAYYFSANPDDQSLKPIIEYLAYIGDSEYKNKWHWLAQAVFLARFRYKNDDLAMELAQKISDLYDRKPGMPLWAKHMPAFVLKEQGDKEAAIEIMLNILEDRQEELTIQDINFTKHYICERILNEEERQHFKLCDGNY